RCERRRPFGHVAQAVALVHPTRLHRDRGSRRPPPVGAGWPTWPTADGRRRLLRTARPGRSALAMNLPDRLRTDVQWSARLFGTAAPTASAESMRSTSEGARQASTTKTAEEGLSATGSRRHAGPSTTR